MCERIGERIARRRRQVLVHSIIYYRFGSSLVPDATYDEWARELAALQAEHPEVSAAVEYHSAPFSKLTPTSTTGFDLPLDDPAATAVAASLLLTGRSGGSHAAL